MTNIYGCCAAIHKGISFTSCKEATMQFESTEKRTTNQKSGTKNHMISRLEISAKGDNSQLNEVEDCISCHARHTNSEYKKYSPNWQSEST